MMTANTSTRPAAEYQEDAIGSSYEVKIRRSISTAAVAGHCLSGISTFERATFPENQSIDPRRRWKPQYDLDDRFLDSLTQDPAMLK
jgi:hypothetical protein